MVIISSKINTFSFLKYMILIQRKYLVVNTMGRTKGADIILERKVCGVTLFFGIEF